jgi:hypothetical protein
MNCRGARRLPEIIKTRTRFCPAVKIPARRRAAAGDA